MFLRSQDFLTPSPVRGVKLFSYSRERYAGDWKSYAHEHAYAEIFYVLSGKGTFRTAAKDYPLRRGTLVINNPNVMHCEFSSEAEPLEYAVFSIENAAFTASCDETESLSPLFENAEAAETIAPAETAPAADSHGDKNAYIPEANAHLKSFVFYDLPAAVAEKTVQTIEREIAEKRPLFEAVCANAFSELLLYVLRETRLNATARESAAAPSVSSYAKDYLDAHFIEEITLDRLAKAFYVGKYHLAHAFKAAFGVSPMRYLATVRCNRARKLLLRGSYSVAAVSESVGYSSVSYFSAAYKKMFGETPQETRKRARPADSLLSPSGILAELPPKGNLGK